MTDTPFPMIWDGEAFRAPTPYWEKKARERFLPGQKYLLMEQLERSVNAHRHFFANLFEAFHNLPEEKVQQFPTLEHFRKTGLIMTGWRDETVEVFASQDDALKAAALIRPRTEFELVVVHENTVTVLTPKSQSMRQMGAKDFQRSKQDVLAWAWGLCGVDPETGEVNAGRAA